MCGICGVVSFGQERVEEHDVRAMAETIAHRGPDSDGFFVAPDGQVGLGFRRLSIVDLTTGDQPMPNEDGSIWLIFNGEIYNHAEYRPRLEALGHRYRSRSDAEVILHLYEEYGPDCVDYLRGMFAFALWDSRRRRLLLARDRVGIKPLYFAVTPEALLFGSEIKALFAQPRAGLSPRLNEEALSLYLTFAAVPPPQTLFDGVEKLPAGHRLIVDADSGERRLERYWAPLPDAELASVTLADEEYVDRLEALVRESIGLHMMSDVPYGAFLSGGVDSSLNVALMAELADRPVATFSVAIEGDGASDELEFARHIAQRYGTQHHEVTIGERDFVDYLPRLVWHQDEPLADPVCVPLHAISEATRASGTKVVQVGEGSDELFAGYTGYAFFVDFHRRVWRPYQVLPGALRRMAAGAATHMLSMDRADVVQRAGRGDELYWGGAIAFYDAHKRALLRDGSNGIAQRMVRELYADVDRALPAAGQLDRMIGIELRQRLPELLLMRVDKVSMGSSIEARVPYLDHKLVELALAIPPHVKYRNGTTKWVLKRVAERVGLPRELVYRRKRGFCGSATNMLTPRLLDAAESAVFDSSLARERFNFPYLRRMFDEQRAGRSDHAFRIWNLWNLVEWHARWFDVSAAVVSGRGR
jgi:asparagine synthase (glutamine-hydrolysing)